MRFPVLLIALLVTAGCAVPASRTRAYSSGAEQPSVRAAVDGNGDLSEPQELVAINLPIGPFTVKGGVVWNGATWSPIIPGVPMSAQSASPCAAPAPQAQAVSEECVQSQSMETYTEMVPVQRQRRVITPSTIRTYRVVTPGTPYVVDECAPAPQAAPPCAPTAPPFSEPAPAAPKPIGCLPREDPCPNGCCEMPVYTAAR